MNFLAAGAPELNCMFFLEIYVFLKFMLKKRKIQICKKNNSSVHICIMTLIIDKNNCNMEHACKVLFLKPLITPSHFIVNPAKENSLRQTTYCTFIFCYLLYRLYRVLTCHLSKKLRLNHDSSLAKSLHVSTYI